MKGGGICSDGKICILTKQWMQNRSPQLSANEIEKTLKKFLKIEHVIWLEQGLFCDETIGHADEVVAFKNEREILLSWTDDPTNPNYEICRKNHEILTEFYEKQKTDVVIHKIITPKPFKRKKCETIDGTFRNQDNLVAISYINFLNLENAIIFPQFGVKEDRIAFQQFKRIFNHHKILKLNCREIALGGGGIHCVTKNY